MIIINDRYAIDFDAYNFILKEKRIRGEKSKDSGGIYYKDIGFYGNFEGAIKWIINQGIKESGATNFDSLLEYLENMKNELVASIEKLNTDTSS